MTMPGTQTAETILDRQYLEMRCGLLDLAAAFDRISRAEHALKIHGDVRLQLLKQAIEIVASERTDRAERLQILFSDEYIAGWNKS